MYIFLSAWIFYSLMEKNHLKKTDAAYIFDDSLLYVNMLHD